MHQEPLQIAQRTFQDVVAAFPKLQMHLSESPAVVDLELSIPAQPGMLFDVSLNLQNLDELHSNAGELWVSWFPCTRPDRTADYLASVVGLLAGHYRILETYRGDRPVKAQLQKPVGNAWKTIAARWHLISFPWPRKTLKILRNEPPVA